MRAQILEVPLVAATEVLYHTRARRPLQDVLTCLRHRTNLSSAGRLLKPNDMHDIHSNTAMEQLYADEPVLLTRTLEVAERCTFSMDELRYRYPSENLPDGTTTAAWLRQLTYVGAAHRYNNRVPAQVTAQLEKELQLITMLDYCGYFLTMAEIVRFCREQEILCQGRGSAANSAVCYCLGITAIDPVRMGLLFERFISMERAEPPDIDLDIAHERREEVIQHVYQKYGRSHAAMVANVVRYRSRSAVRDVGKVLGLPETSLDRLAKLFSYHDGDIAEVMSQAGHSTSSGIYQQLLELVAQIRDFPRHLSIHPGGFLLGHEPITDLVPIENATMEKRTVIQWDKYDVEALGLFKVDLLGLGALTQLDRCFRLLESHHQVRQSMATIPANCSKTYEMICRGDTVGVFQIESRAQMAMLPRLKPKTFYDLVIEVSIVRPGPITGGMVHPYLRRRNGEEAVIYPHPCLEPVLKKTLGVPLFQEQVMRLAVVAADYTPGEADQLRRDMGAWRRSGRIEAHRERLISRMVKKGIDPQFAEQVFNQIRGFGEYGFPESHAASFALIAYATSWLRCHYPAAFTCALLNAQPMGFYSPATIVDDAKRNGVVFRAIDVTISAWDCSLEPTDEGELCVRMGGRYLKSFRRSWWNKIIAAREAKAFENAKDFGRRTALDKGARARLAESGALAAMGYPRRSALWALLGVEEESEGAEERLLEHHEPHPILSSLTQAERIRWDYKSHGHSVLGHPLAPMREALTAQGFPHARRLETMPHGRRVRYAGLVICRQRPGTASGVTFMTLEDETGFVNVVIFKKVFDRFSLLGKSALFLGVSGRLQVEKGVVHLVAEQLWEPQVNTAFAVNKSRDFH
ncbi:MAG TPA: DNA polymerase III subunit alpha, partial [Myxococcales bacterium]|nr:DNA polymerase III subunit alpha [Myxococcales bacterium]